MIKPVVSDIMCAIISLIGAVPFSIVCGAAEHFPEHVRRVLAKGTQSRYRPWSEVVLSCSMMFASRGF
jgi:hypothetical protein